MLKRSYPPALLACASLLLLLPAVLRAQSAPAQGTTPAAGAATLRGTLTDAAGQPLVGATVFVKSLSLGTSVDEQGRFALELPRGTHAVTYSFVGYAPQTETLTLTSRGLTRNVRLTQGGVKTDEVVVTGHQAVDNVKSTEMGVTRLDMKTIRMVPPLLGEWVFSLYNAYGRKNPYSIYLRQNADNPQQSEAVRLSIFGALLPSVTYNFTF